MKILDIIIEYVKNFYVIIYDPRTYAIIFCDEFDGPNSNNFSDAEIINIGSIERNTIVVYWGKIKDITGIEFYQKDLNHHIKQLFRETIKSEKTKSFLKILINENLPVSFHLSEMPEEFPNIFFE